MFAKLTTLLIITIFCLQACIAQAHKDSTANVRYITLHGLGNSTDVYPPDLMVYFQYDDSTFHEFLSTFSFTKDVVFEPFITLQFEKEYALVYKNSTGIVISRQPFIIDTVLTDSTLYIDVPRLWNWDKRGETVYFQKHTDSVVSTLFDSLHHVKQRLELHQGRIEILVFNLEVANSSKDLLNQRLEKILALLESMDYDLELITIYDNFYVPEPSTSMYYLGSEHSFFVLPPSNIYALSTYDPGILIRYIEE